jgi:hypothetical protein
MRRLLWLALIPWVTWAEPPATPPVAGEPSHCPDCHQKEQQEFMRSLMAVAAGTPDYISEWGHTERAAGCLKCHAPGGGKGVVCNDCHGDTGHPYPKLAVPGICARCHDAPGELTVRSFSQSSAARRGEDCLGCHLPGNGISHDFQGPARQGFLEGAARLRISLRRDAEGDAVLIRIRHRAGHALPGGTTGRSVWLLVEEIGEDERPLARSLFRFGWYHDPATGWRDRTLPPGPGKVIEIPLTHPGKVSRVQAKLIYRFLPGALDNPDSREVMLDQAVFALPAGLEESR